MKGRTIQRHLRESLKSVSRNRWMTFASVSAVTVTLLLVGVSLIIMMNLNQIASNIEQDVEMKVFLELAATDEEVEALTKQLKETKGIEDVQFSSKENELDHVVKGFGEEFGLYKQENPLRHVFYVKASEPQQTAPLAKEIATYPTIYEVKYGEGKVERLFSVLNKGRTVGLVLIVALLCTAAFLISNTIKITIMARSREIEIMKLVGATNQFIRMPFLFEGMLLGMLGAVIPIIALSIGYWNLYAYIQPRIIGDLFQPLSVMPFVLQLNLLLLAIGVLIGLWGSFMSVRKFLKV